MRRFRILVDVTRHLRSRPRLPYGLHFQTIALIKVGVRDQLICQHHQCLMRTVIGRKAVNLAIRKCLSKRHHRAARIAPTEPINTLANIPYKKQIPIAPCKGAGDFPLDIRCILGLIHEDMVKRHLVLGANTGIFTQKHPALEEEVIKVQPLAWNLGKDIVFLLLRHFVTAPEAGGVHDGRLFPVWVQVREGSFGLFSVLAHVLTG